MQSIQSEEFRPIPGFPNHRVSNLGRVQSRIKKVRASVGRGFIYIIDTEWHDLKRQVDNWGYAFTTVTDNGVQQRYRICRLLAEVFLEKPVTTRKLCVRHLNDDRTNDSLSNLAWGTYTENHADAVKNGCTKNNYRAILAPAQVIEIREYATANPNISHREIAEKYGVSIATISNLLDGHSWANLPNPYKKFHHRGKQLKGVLTMDQANEIRHLFKNGDRNCDLAIKFGVPRPTISKIIHNKTYRNVD